MMPFAISRVGLCFAAAIGLSFGAPASAGDPSAIVEEINAAGVKLRFMDYVEPGLVISLGESGTLSLGYLNSCVHETITGGRVIVGVKQSEIVGGEVKRVEVECDGGTLELTTEQAGKSAVMVLRRPPKSPSALQDSPQITIYGTSPVIRLTEGSNAVAIDRLDRAEKPIEINLREGFADLSVWNLSLQPGGIYRARAGGRAIVFNVDPSAQPGAGPIFNRLVRF